MYSKQHATQHRAGAYFKNFALGFALTCAQLALGSASAQTNEALEKRSLQISTLFRQGDVAFKTNDFQKVIRDFTQVINLKPPPIIMAVAHINRGLAYGYLKNYSSSIKDFTQAIVIDPNLANAYTSRGVSYYILKDYSSAIRDFTQSIALNPNDALAYYKRGTVYGDLKDHSSAIRDFTQAISLKPNYADAYNNRAVILLLKSDYRNATSDARKACSLGSCNMLEVLGKNGWLRD